MSPATYARPSPSSLGIHSSRRMASGDVNRSVATVLSGGLSFEPSQNSKRIGILLPKLPSMTGLIASATWPVGLDSAARRVVDVVLSAWSGLAEPSHHPFVRFSPSLERYDLGAENRASVER